VLINMTGATAASSPYDPHPEPQDDPTPDPPTVADIITLPCREILLSDDVDTIEMETEIKTDSVPVPVHISVPDLAFMPISVPDPDSIPISVPVSPISVPVDVSVSVFMQDSVPPANASPALSGTKAPRGRPPAAARKRKAVEVEESEDPGSSSSRRSPLTVLPSKRTSSRFALPQEKEKEVKEKEKVKEKKKGKENEEEKEKKENEKNLKEQEKEEKDEDKEMEEEKEKESSEPQPQVLEDEEAKTESPATSPSSSSSSKTKRAKRSEDAPLKGRKATESARGSVQNGRPVRSAKLYAAAALVASKGEW
jgi:hypothetical protein